MPASKASSRKPWLFVALTVGVLIAAIVISKVLLSTAPSAERRHPQRAARLVDVTVVHPASEPVTLTAYGQVAASQQVQLSAQVAGVITALGDAFVPGRRVREGEMLVQIDPRDYRLTLASAEASLASAEANLTLEQGNQAVARGDVELLDLQVDTGERALMLREPQLKAAQASVASARAAVERARLDLARTTLRAPFDALVLSRNVGVGTQVNGRVTVLGELAAAEPFWVTLLLPVEDVQWIDDPESGRTSGSTVELADATRPDVTAWRGRVIEIIDAVEAQGRRAQVLVEVTPESNAPPLLLGTYVQARIHGRALENAFRLDPAWLQGDRVWTVRDDVLAAVKVDVRFRDERSVLVSGLRDGERIVSSLLAGAVDGMRVRTADAATTPAADAPGPAEPQP
ncbi:MAG: efflux RND transporter periplasmic adaptor subunit [Nevskiales bacterium]|nr:efflux RND transporter periplasmic adaptor subunit [Nevskiales bacterium]